MQSIVFPVAHYTNENMLVCAPTGSGKTDVAMLTILKTIRDHIDESNTLIKSEFKIVYVAPMKALAAEITSKFSTRLKPFSLHVREYTGDIQLSRREVQETHVIVTTPEKWDVITRKSVGDVDLVAKVRLLIIDEVHLLQDDRGPVIETIVARTLREVEISQRMIRIVGLSATLPNFVDVAVFLRVDLINGLFVFGEAFRPVPLTQHFVGIKGRNSITYNENLTRVCFDKCREFVTAGHQVMIFVHSRMDTVRTAKQLLKTATELGCSGLFSTEIQSNVSYERAKKQLERSRNKELQSLFYSGLAFHHAGMVRSDRSLVESLFAAGYIKVLCSTATLAWGVNLPAHAVIIKGTKVYDQDKGDFVSLGVLDVLQIFGRAGRPQYETHGEGLILTPHADLAKYINSILSQIPIESQFISHLADNLNAEVALGTVSSINEAIAWLKYSYLYVRMQRNPTAYGISPHDLSKDPDLTCHLEKICWDTAKQLCDCGMSSLEPNGLLRIRDVGRIASSFYLTMETIQIFGQTLTITMNEDQVLAAACLAAEFKNLRVREEELEELDRLYEGSPMHINHDVTTCAGKAAALIVAFIAKYELDTFSLISDSNYIAQNSGRIFRALFEILKSQGWLLAALRCLTMCKAFERRVWPMQHPLCQYNRLSPEIVHKLESKAKDIDLEAMSLMNKGELAALIDDHRAVNLVKRLVSTFPRLELQASIYPITAMVLCIDLHVRPNYIYDDSVHKGSDLWWIFIENPLAANYLHCEEFLVTKGTAMEVRKLTVHIALPEPLPGQVYIRAVSDVWMHAENTIPLTLSNLSLPDNSLEFTELLPLEPLPITALNNSVIEGLYSESFSCFNPVQTQVFDALYHDERNVLIGAPTGSGKTLLADLAIWNAIRIHGNNAQIVYVAPLKALLKEKLTDWNNRLRSVGVGVVELSGDTDPNYKALLKATIILTTPEKWDSVTRSNSLILKRIVCIILDEIHLLGAERGQVLEMIVTRMRYHSADVVGQQIRIIGLSTTISNSKDLAQWMGPKTIQFNFRPSVRPVPLEVRIDGFGGRHYCPRMAAMNKPIYSAIASDSSNRPVLVFVSSRRQTRLTAMALISYCVHDNAPHRFIRMDQEELYFLLEQVQDGPLKHALSFGIALHHAGLIENDRYLSETLFAQGKLQVMVATSTLAWGVNFPAHMVIVKGTEYFDATSHTYVDYPLTDVMQMIGRAGRPQFDTSAKAVLLVKDSKKTFYKKFLYESFPLESSLHLKDYLADYLNAEIANGRIKNENSAMTILKDTFLAIRLARNPNYYGLTDGSKTSRDEHLAQLVNDSVERLKASSCITLHQISNELQSTDAGRIASNFYICHRTMRLFHETIGEKDHFGFLLCTLSLASEFDQVPVRHNEDNEMFELANVPLLKTKITELVGPLFFSAATSWNDPHTKVFILLVANIIGMALPVMDFVTDTKSILEQAARVVRAMAEFAQSNHYLETFVQCIWLVQSLERNEMPPKGNFCRIPGIKDALPISLPSLLHSGGSILKQLKVDLLESESERILNYLAKLPKIQVQYSISKDDKGMYILKCILNNTSSYFPSERCIWHIVVATKNNNAIIAYTKVSIALSRQKAVEMLFAAPHECQDLSLLILSENFHGLDQEYDLIQR